jgi:hypothetical protein
MSRRLLVSLLLSIPVPMLRGTDLGLVNLLPPGAHVLFGAGIAYIRDTPFGSYAVSRAGRFDKELAELAAITGFDPRRDIVEIAGAAGGATGRVGFLAVRGAFDAARITSVAEARGCQVTSYRAVRIISAAGESHVLAVLDPTLLIAGSLREVTSGIDRWQTGAEAPPELASRLTEAGSLYDVWFVSIGSPARIAGHVPNSPLRDAMKGEIIQAIQEVSGGIKFGPDVRVYAESITRSHDDAVALAGVLRFFASLAELHIGRRYAGLSQALSSGMQLSTDANRVRLSLSIPEPEFEKLMEQFQDRGKPKDPPVAANQALPN